MAREAGEVIPKPHLSFRLRAGLSGVNLNAAFVFRLTCAPRSN